jgi:hypothetical protein
VLQVLVEGALGAEAVEDPPEEGPLGLHLLLKKSLKETFQFPKTLREIFRSRSRSQRSSSCSVWVD